MNRVESRGERWLNSKIKIDVKRFEDNSMPRGTRKRLQS
jgi:hypothetical protein